MRQFVSELNSIAATWFSFLSHAVWQAMLLVIVRLEDRLHPQVRRFEQLMDDTIRRIPRLPRPGMAVLVALACVTLPGLSRAEGDQSGSTKKETSSPVVQVDQNAQQKKPSSTLLLSEPGDAVPAAIAEWLAGTPVTGRVLNHAGVPVANAEVLLLGEERVVVDTPGKPGSRWIRKPQDRFRHGPTKTASSP